MNDKVRKALEERNKRQQENQKDEEKKTSDSNKTRKSKINDALEARKQRITTTLPSTLDDLSKRYESVLNSHNNSVATPMWGRNATDIRNGQRENMLATTDLIRDFEAYRKYFGDDATDSILASLGEIKTSQLGIYDNAEIFSQYKTEKEYNAAYKEYQRQQEEDNKLLSYDLKAGADEIASYQAVQDEMRSLMISISDMKDVRNAGKYTQADIAAADARYKELEQKYGYWDELNNLIEEKEAYYNKAEKRQKHKQQEDYYEQFRLSPDFEEKSKYASTYRGGEVFSAVAGMYTDTGFDDIEYDAINRNETARDRIRLEDLKSGSAFLGYDKSYLYEMTDEEIALYNSLYDPNDKTASDEYLRFLLSDLNYRRRDTQQQQWAQMAKEDPVGTSIASILMAPSKSFTAIGQVADYVSDGAIDQNAGYNKFSHIPSSIRGQVASDIAESGNWGEVGSWTYQLGMSMGDFLMTTAASGGNKYLSLALMGSGAMADTVIASKDRGLSDDQAFTLGVVAGAAEIITEKFSLDALFDVGADQGAIKYILKNAFVEGTEEVSSSVINLAADVLISKEKSEWAMAIQRYLDENPGATESEAFQKVLQDEMMSLGLDFLGGTIMGGSMGTGGAVINTVGQNATTKAQYGEFQRDLVGEALEIDPGNAFAQRMQGRLDKGKNLSGGQINRLVQQNEAALTAQDITAIQSAVKSRLTKLGETGDVSAIAAAITKQATGKKLSKAEWQLVSGNEYAHRVLNELNPENIRSGEYSSSWAEKIDTQRINVDEYSRLVEAAQQPQKTAEVTGEQVVAKTPKMAQTAQPGAVTAPAATIQENRTVEGNADDKTIQLSSGKEVIPQKITSIKNGKAIIQTDNGKIAAEDIVFGNADMDLLWRSAVQFSGITPAGANGVIRAYQRGIPVTTYLTGAAQEFKNGYHNLPSGGKYADKLTPSQRTIIYDLGQKAAGENVAKKQAQIEASNKKTATEKTSATVKKGGVYYSYEGQTISEKVSSGKALNAKQSVGVEFAERLAKSRGITFYFYESYVNENGDWVYKDKNGNIVKAENGFYDPSDGSIHIDLNAGYDGKGTVLFTISHELVHFIKDWSPKHFKQMANILMKEYRQKNVPVDTLVKMQQANAQEHGRELSYDEAYEEVIADSMETILADGKVMELMQDIEKADKSLGQKIKEFFQDIVQLLKDTINAYRGVEPDTVEGTLVSQMDDLIAELQQVFAEGVYEAGDNYRKVERNNTQEGGVHHMSRDQNGNVVVDEDVDPQKVKMILTDIYNGNYKSDNNYFPVLKNTPEVYKRYCHLDADRSFVMAKKKAYKAMQQKNKNQHALGVDGLMYVIENLGTPDYIVYQNVGEYAGNYAAIIISEQREIFAAVQLGEYKDAQYAPNRERGYYNTLITAFYPNEGYIDNKILIPENDVVYDKNEDPLQVASGVTPSDRAERSSKTSIRNPQADVKENSSTDSNGLKFSSRKGTAQFALEHFGRTYSWKETGYLLTDGSKLDFSGRHEGASGGYRTVDHRDILDIYPEETEMDGNGAMVDFMRQGNIRIMPEGDGINLQVQPTKAQERALDDFISKARGEVTLDIDDSHGNVIVSVEYPRGTRATKVLQDIKNYFENGTEPVISELAKFHYFTRKKLNASVTELLQQENEKLKEDVQHLKDLLKLQRTVTGGTKFTKTSVEAAARMLKNGANARGDTAELAKLLNTFYEGIATDKELSWESVREKAKPAVDWLQSHTEVKPERSEYAKDILSHLRTSRIYLDDVQKNEVAYRYGSYDAYRKMMMGSIILAKEGSVSLDSKWQELSAMYPDVFDSDTTATDMPEALIEAISMLRNSDTNVLEYEYNKDLIAQDILRQVYDSYWKVSTLRTFADSKQREINNLKAMHYQRLDKLRANNAAQIEQMKADHRATVERINIQHQQQMEKQQEELRQQYKESKKKAIETRDKREAREKLQKLVLDTVKWITYPSKTDVKCPDILKQPYAEFLNSIDLSSQRLANGGDPTKNDLRLTNAMSSLATALERILDSQNPNIDLDNVDSAVLDAGYLDLPVDFVKVLRKMTEDIKAMMGNSEYVVNRMPSEGVRKLTQMIRTLNHAIKEVSTLYANLRFANVEALGDNTMSFVDSLGEIEKTGGMKDFVQWDNALPFYAFRRFGEGGESIFEGLMDAQDKLAFLAQKIFDFQEKAWKGKEAKAWSEDTHTIDLPDGDTLTLTTADAMSIYCLSRREHALPHLLGGGVRVIGIQKGSQKAKDSYSLLTVKDIDTIISSLTDRQLKVAEAIQEFMSTVCSEWGNEISMKRFLTKEFNEKFYFPIESNDENLPEKDPSAQQSDLYRLLNISATKPLTNEANNEVIIRNIFDVFSGHASDMARLNSYGMALLDYMKWLNYREKTVNEEGQIKGRGVRKSLKKAFGNAAGSYIRNLIKDVNGRPSDGGDPTILMKWMRAAKTASVGSSLRVATLQITSYPRAALVLSPKNLALGLTKLPQIGKAKKYCGIALWKSFGFYETNISRSIEEQIKGVKDVKQKLIELSLKGAEWGDAITWGALWNACEYEVAATKQYKVGTEEFNQAVGKKLREVVYRTQVVDSTLTRSQIMRSKRGMAQEAAAFMSEPTVSANILMDAGFQFNAEKRRTGSVKAAWKKTGAYITRAVAVYSIGQLAAALLEGLWDAWRDDDDEKFSEKYLDAFIENLILDLVPFNKIPIISDVFGAVLAMFNVGFYSSDKMSSTWLTQAVSAVDAWKTVISGDSSTTTYNALYKTMRAISSFYGVSFSGVMREGVDLWNNTAGSYDTTLKIRQYELSKADLGAELYYAIISGDTKQAESLKAQFEDPDSMSAAIRKALRENDPRIKKAAEARFSGDYVKYKNLFYEIKGEGIFDFDTIMGAINAEVNELEKKAKTGATNETTKTDDNETLFTVEDYYKAVVGNDKASAELIYNDLIAEMDSEGYLQHEAEDAIATGFATQVGKAYMAGEISRSEALRLLEENTDKDETQVKKWDFELEYSFSWGERVRKYRLGQISEWELMSAVMDIEGEDREAAEAYIDFLDLEMANEDTDITANDAEGYFKYAEPAGIAIEVYLDYKAQASKCESDRDANGKVISGTKKAKILDVIHSLPITIAQKDALYFANNYAKSEIYETPWH